MNLQKKLTLVTICMIIMVIANGCKSETKPDNIGLKVTSVKTNEASSKKVYEAVGQVRNNRMDIDSSNIVKLLWDDPVFNKFEDTKMTYKEYEQKLFDEAKNKGIDEKKLRKALETAKTLRGNDVLMYPVIIDTALHNDKDCFVFVFTWEVKDMANAKNTVSPLGHIFIVAMETDTQNVIEQNGCM